MKRLLLAIAILLIPCWLMGAETYYVKNGGNDSADGKSDANAWASLSKCEASPVANGDTILLKCGSTWAGVRGLRVKYNLTITSYGSGAQPYLNSANALSIGYYVDLNGVSVSNLHVDGVFSTLAVVSNLTIDNVTVTSSAGNGIYVKYVDTFTIKNCNISGMVGSGIVVQGSATNKATNGIIEYNTVSGGADGIVIHGDSSNNSVGDNHTIRYNTITGGQTENCIDLDAGAVGTLGNNVYVYNNTCGGALGTFGIGGSGMTNSYYYNNYVYDAAGAAFYAPGPGPQTFYNNYAINTDGGFYISDSIDTTNVNIYNNTIVGGAESNRSAITIYGRSGANTGFDIKNNIIVYETQPFVLFYTGATADNTVTTLDNNQYYDSGGYTSKWYMNGTSYSSLADWRTALGGAGAGNDNSSAVGDPLLTGYTIPSNSPCKDTGTNTSVATDIRGLPRPFNGLYDIGAYEIGGGFMGGTTGGLH